MKKLTGVIIILGTACLVIIAGLVLRATQPQGTLPFGSRPVPVWITQPDQSSAQTPDGVFGASAALVTPGEIILFYEMQSHRLEVPQVSITASSLLNEAGTQLSTSMAINNAQALGQLSGIGVGAIHMPRANQPGQVLTMNILPEGSKDTPWQIAPLKQLTSDPGKQEVAFLPIQTTASLVKLELGSLGGESNYAVLKLSLPTKLDVLPLFLRVDHQSVVSQITEAEYNALTASSGATELQRSESATPAPMEKP